MRRSSCSTGATWSFSVAMNGLNSSVTPLSAVPADRAPHQYANWQAERLLAVLDDSYLFDLEFEIVNATWWGSRDCSRIRSASATTRGEEAAL